MAARPVTRSTASSGRPRGWIAMLIHGVGRPLWRRRVELAIVVLPLLLQRLLAAGIGGLAATICTAAVIVASGASPELRRWVCASLTRSRVRRAWWRACLDAGLAVPTGRSPRIDRLRAVPAGWLLRVRVLRGQSADLITQRAELLAASLGARDVRVSRDAANAAVCEVFMVTRDPLAECGALPWPWAGAGRCSVWEPIPVGVGEHGETVCVQLPERHLLVGGEPGAGKSVGLSMIAATAALDPDCRLWLLDGKLVELAAWQPAAERLAGPDIDEALAVLEELRTTMDERYRVLLDRARRKVESADGLPLTCSSATSWRSSSLILSANRARHSRSCFATSSRVGAPPASSSSPRRRSPARTSSRPRCATSSASAGRFAATRRRPRTRSSARAGRASAGTPPRYRRGSAASACCCTRRPRPCGCVRSTSTTGPSTRSFAAP